MSDSSTSTSVKVETSSAAPLPQAGPHHNRLLNSEFRRVTKRLVITILGGVMIWWFLREHRNWVWVYFESMMELKNPTESIAGVAKDSIKAITTIAITGITGIVTLVIWFVTGNVAVLAAASKFGGIDIGGSVVNQVTKTTTQRHEAGSSTKNDP